LDLTDATDTALASAIANGQGAAHQAELYRRMAPRVRAYGLRHLRDGARADDLVQSVMLTVLDKLETGQVEQPERIASFVLGTSRHMVADTHKTERRRRNLLEQATPQLRELAIGWTATAFVDRQRLTSCLGQLEPRHLTVVLLSFYAGRTGPQIADEIGTSAANVRVLRHRALGSLRDCVTGGDA
jgi:RNA polymerase sigma-70 factor (ECF subfamily)